MAIRYLSGVNIDSNTLVVDDVNNLVGIGTSSPGSYNAGVNNLVVGNLSGFTGITISSGSSQEGAINFADGLTGNQLYRGVISYSHLSDAMWFYTSGSERLRITSAGNVGIGTTNPISKLHVAGSTYVNGGTLFIDSEQYLRWGNSNQGIRGVNDTSLEFVSGGSERMRITAAGNVGIGTTSPTLIGTGITTLDIQGSNAGGVAFGPSGVKNYIYGASTMYVEAHTTAVFATSGSEKMRITAAGTVAIGNAGSGGGYGIEINNSASTPRIDLVDNSNYTAQLKSNGLVVTLQNNSNNALVFGTNGTERVRVTAGGNVGIGTTSPTVTLEVSGRGLITSSGSSDTFAVTHSSGSGIGVNITKGGNGEGLYVNKTSGSGNAVTIVGTLNATTLVKSGGTSSQYLMADGSVSTLTNPVTGTGTTNYVPKWTSGSAIGNSAIYDNAGNIGVGIAAPQNRLSIGSAQDAGIDFLYDGFNNYKNQIKNYWNSGTDTRMDFNIGNTSGVAPVTVMSVGYGGNVGIGTTSPSAKLDVNGDINLSNYGSLTGGTAANRMAIIKGTGASGNIEIGGLNNADVIIYTHVNERMRITAAGNVGVGTTSPNRTLTVIGTKRHERVYAYANNTFNLTNDISLNTLWLHLGTQAAFTTDKIYYRVGTSTSEEEGEIIVKNTCSTANIEWHRNSYNVMVTAVKARMQGSCQPCEIWIQVRYGSSYGGASTNIQWQVQGGTDSNFVTVNNTGTPGTGTNEANIASTDGYIVANSDNQSIGGSLGVGTTSPGSRIEISGTTGSYNSGIGFVPSGTGARNYRTFIATDGSFRFDDATAGATRTMLTSGGNLLIGTTTDAGYKLYVSGTGTSTNLAVVGNIKAGGTGTAGGEIIASGALGNGNFVSLRHDDNNAYITVTRVVYDGHLILQPYGNVGIGTASPNAKLEVAGQNVLLYRPVVNASAIYAAANNTFSWQWGINDGADYIITGGGFAGLGTERLRITSGGNVGIGTNNPTEILQVNGSNAAVLLTGAVNTSGFKLSVREDGQDVQLLSQGSGGGMRFFVNAGSEAMRIASSGNVLIGTTTDSGEELVVNGNIGVPFSTQIRVAGGGYTRNDIFQTGYNNVSDLKDFLILDPPGSSNGKIILGTGSYVSVGIGTNSPSSGLVVATYGSKWDSDVQYNQPAGNIFSNLGICFADQENWIGLRGSYNSSSGSANLLLQANFRDVGSNAGHYVASQAISLGNADFVIGRIQTQTSVSTAPAKVEQLRIFQSGKLKLNLYGSGTFTGTPTYNLGVDASGNVIELPGGVVDGSGTANKVAKWSDSNTLTDSGIEDTSSSVSIGRAAFYSPSNYGTYYSALTGASSGTAWYDTITGATGVRVYNMVVQANPNSSGSGVYADFYFGKVFVGTGYNGSAIVHYINYQQESQMPRSLYGSGGGNLTITAFFVVGGTEYTEIAHGTTYTIRIKIAGYVNAGAGTEITLQRIM